MAPGLWTIRHGQKSLRKGLQWYTPSLLLQSLWTGSFLTRRWRPGAVDEEPCSAGLMMVKAPPSKMEETVRMLAREAWSMSKVLLTPLDPLKGVGEGNIKPVIKSHSVRPQEGWGLSSGSEKPEHGMNREPSRDSRELHKEYRLPSKAIHEPFAPLPLFSKDFSRCPQGRLTVGR